MSNFRSSEGGRATFNENICLSDLRAVDIRSLIALYVSKTLLFVGIILVFLNNLNVIAPGNYFGEFSWVTSIVFIIGILINFVSIPLLYFSSFKNFKRESYFWDRETFWILPLFFFGTFFLYNAKIPPAIALLVFSIIVITLVHIRFVFEAKKILIRSGNPDEHFIGHEQYFVTLKYLSTYYILLLILLVFYNPLARLFLWIRMHT